MRRTLSNLLIIAGVLIIAVAVGGNIYANYRQQKMMEEWMNTDFFEDEAEVAAVEDLSVAQGALLDIVEEEASALAEPSAPATTEPEDETPASPTPIPAPTKKPLMPRSEIEAKMIGTLMIEKIDVKLPVLNGVDEETLRVAAGRMPQTGMPDEIGNMVLAGHRSYTFGKYLNRLDELEVGDEVIIQTKEKKLKYKVFKKLIVEPDDFSILNKNSTDKVLTLFTCHPVVIASHRLVVHAVQIN